MSKRAPKLSDRSQQHAASRQHPSARFLALSAPCIALVLASCKTERVQPFDPLTLQQPQRNSAREAVATQMRPLPTTLESPFLANQPGGATTRPSTPPPTTGPALGVEPTMRLPLREIVQRAVMNNLDVRVAGYEPAIEGTRITEAEARFDPTYFAATNYQRRERGVTFNTNVTSGGVDEADTITAQTGIRQLLPSGGQAEIRYQATRTDLGIEPTATNPVLDPAYESELVLEVTQPLLRDFGNEVNRARIVVNRLNQHISLLDFRRQLEETALEIEQTYWRLTQSIRDVQVLEGLLQQTIDTAELLWRRRGQDVTRVQLSQANASVEQRRATLIRAKARVRDLSDQLKRLMNDPSLPVASPTLVLPANDPLENPLRFDLKDQIDTALENRAELGEQQLRVESADVTRRVAENNNLPQLNVVGQAGIQGLDENYGDAASNNFSDPNFSWGVGLQFEIPIGNRAARAVYRRSLLQRQQAVEQYRNLIEQISLEVKQAQRDVETSWQEMASFRQSRFAAADALLALQQRQDANEPLTPEFVQLKLDRQQELSNRFQQENEAISNYNISIARLEQVKGTLLRYNNVVMEEDKLPIARK